MTEVKKNVLDFFSEKSINDIGGLFSYTFEGRQNLLWVSIGPRAFWGLPWYSVPLALETDAIGHNDLCTSDVDGTNVIDPS